MKFYNLRAVLYLAAAFISASTALLHAETIVVSDPWVRHAPPTVKSHAGYLTMKNNDKTNRTLTSARSPLYERVEIHASKVENGIATMHRVEQIDIKPGRMVVFKPGGLHLMLIGPKKRLAVGNRIPVEFVFRNGDELKMEAIVKKSSGSGNMHNHHNMKMN